ncbi:hypothetical protein LZ198_28615 [Myxococcus sp. K15C18031901]|uniref:hypothetical protein n=1 Tax=Myxococcus dinghuensis TaxID=2906761 RepID=UPI0020A7D5D4|nr:hypothetical protein [Myxococcus dinghuensis]MCP3102847.1 hypothetical protein [Myxococcus dinghuensis]
MHRPSSVRGTFLACALTLALAPGCEPASPLPSPSGPRETHAQALSCADSQVPVMTGTMTPSGLASASSIYAPAFDAWKVFDNVDTSASMWISNIGQLPVWLQYEWMDGARYVTRYALTFANGSLTSRAPRSWTLQGWTGSTWAVLDTRTNETNWLGVERREYTIASPGAYPRYRLHVTEDNDPRTGIEVISLAKFDLMGCAQDTTPPAPPTLLTFTPPSPSTVLATSLSGTAEPDATVRLFTGSGCLGSPVLTTTASPSGTFSFSPTTTANGVSSFSAKAVDGQGNTSACSAAIGFLHDNVPPAIPSQLVFIPGSPNPTPTPKLTGRTEPAALVQLFSGPGCTGTPLARFTAHDVSGDFSFLVNAAANTTTVFSVRALDMVGNASNCSAAATYVHDSLPPSDPIVEAGLTPLSGGTFAGVLRARTEPEARVALFANADCSTPLGEEGAADDRGEVRLRLTPSQLGVTLFIRAVDAAGNASACVPFSEHCMAGFRDCDGNPANGCEVSVMDDAANCGACGTVCGGAASATGVCGGGTCGLGCVVGTFDCDGNAANGCESATPCARNTCEVTPEQELFITDLSVVEDPVRTTGAGAWTFGTLMRRMNGGLDPSELVRRWMKTWSQPQVVGFSFVPPRPAMTSIVLGPWEARSGGASAPLNFHIAPFRLLAIVNRLDLRQEGTHAGEGRFVFGITDAQGNPMPFTVILEYVLPGDGPEDIQRWARDWHELGQIPLGTPAYNAKLQALTDRFTGAFVAPGRFRGSAISQVRTNENSLEPLWELREFHFGPTGLAPAPLALTPDTFLTGSNQVVTFIQENLADVMAGTHQVPPLFHDQPFQAGSSLAPFFFLWDAPGVDPEARHRFALNTCNGCHTGETQTFFLHVFPRFATQPSGPSPFLLGTTVPDPLTGQPRTFDDLGRRREDLETLVCGRPPSLQLTTGLGGGASLRASHALDDAAPAAIPGFPPRSNLPPGRVH